MCLVDPSSGRLTLSESDFDLPGLIPLRMDRDYRSTNMWESDLGFGWGHTFGARLWTEDHGKKLVYRGPDGRRVLIPTPVDDAPAENRAEGVMVRRVAAVELSGWPVLADLTEGAWQVDTRSMPTQFFETRNIGELLPLRGWADRFSNLVVFRSDRFGMPLRATDPHGRTLHFERDDRGRITRIGLDSPISGPPTIVLVRYEYDGAGDLVAVADAAGTRRYTYDGSHRLTGHANRLGARCVSRFDRNGRCLQTGALGEVKTRRYRYEPDAHRTTVTDSLDGERIMLYDDAEHVIQVTDPNGHVSRFDYDADGRLVVATDPLGGETAILFDSKGAPAGKARPDGGVEGVVADDTGGVTMLLSADGAVTSFKRDKLGRVVELKRPGGGAAALDWNDRGEIIGVTTPFGHTVSLAWSADRRTLVESDDDGVITEQELDAIGRVVRLRDALGAETRYAYDGRGWLTETQFPDGSTRRYEWDAESRLTALIDENGATTRFEYDAGGRRVSVVRPDGQRIRSSYDTENHLTEVATPDGTTHAFTYDPAGLTAAVRFPDGRHLRYSHDALGRVVAMVEPDGARREARLDAVGRIEEVRYPDGTAKLARHTFDGHWTHAEEGGCVIRREVTADGLAVRESCDDYWLVREFGAAGELLSMTDRDGFRVSYEYDVQGHVITLTTAAGAWADDAWAAAGPVRRHEFGYDRAGRRIRWDMPGGKSESRRYNSRGWMVAQVLSHGERTVLSRKYRHDATGRVIGIDDSRRGSVAIELDALGRLKAYRSAGREQPYEYDAADDRTTGLQYEAPHRVKSASGRSYAYDGRGFAVSRSGPRGEERFEWTARGLLALAKMPDGREVRFRHDPHDRLIGREVGAHAVSYFWNDERLWGLSNAGGERVALASLPGDYTPIEQFNAEQGVTMHADHLGTVHELVDDEGTVVWSRDTDPWGQPAAGEPVSAPLLHRCPFGFPGQIRDDVTGLCYNRYRYYDPVSAHYLTPDPVGIFGGLDAYGYVPDPVNLIDPLGLTCRGKNDDDPLYRGDSRPPSDICANGFQPIDPSGNVSVYEHVEGIQGSNWVSTTYDMDVAERFAKDFSVKSTKAPPNAQPYVYIISNPGCGVEVDCDPEVFKKYGNDPNSEKEIAFNGGLPAGKIIGYYHAGQGISSFQACP